MEFVKYEQKGQVGVITIDRPKALNALSAQVLQELDQTIDSVDINATRCLVVTGAGEKAFVAGADIGAMFPLSKAEAKKWCLDGNAVMRKLEKLPVPSIAAVNGFALGGGCELAMACDIRIASENAVFGQPEASLGITAGFGGTQRLPRLIGEGMAKQLLYTTAKVKADKALEIGLVNAVYPLAELMDEAMKLAESIAANAPIAVRATKEAINDGMQTDIDGGIAIEADAFAVCFETADQKNAMGAFLEKRKPDPFQNK
ncbi:MAG: enoyl-CoA hydratase-related protein [Christensenellaceae bacterium]|jgi:enoyl-CoA hydratase